MRADVRDETPVREADVPPWWIRVAHYDGMWLVLSDHHAALPHVRPRGPMRFRIVAGERDDTQCPDCGYYKLRGSLEWVYATNSLAEAEAAFEAAEARLLGRIP